MCECNLGYPKDEKCVAILWYENVAEILLIKK